MSRKLYFFIVILTLFSVQLCVLVKDKELLDNFRLGSGKVTGVRAGVVTGGGIQFKIDKFHTKYNILMAQSNACESLVSKQLHVLKKFNFPVVYLPSNPSNAEILLFESQYKKFGLKIPEELIEIVEALSECE